MSFLNKFFKGMPKTKQKKPLFVASPENCFWVTDGTVIKDLKELRDVVKVADRRIFSYHVNKEKNDFARWVEDVLQDLALAKKLRKIKTKTATLKEINKYLKKNYEI